MRFFLIGCVHCFLLFVWMSFVRAKARSNHVHMCSCLYSTGSKKNVILDGQHKYTVAKTIREKHLEQGLA